MLASECRIGQKVYFGRPNGEKTLGEIVKLNPSKAKVKTLQNRGDHYQAGMVWSVPYSIMTPADGTATEKLLVNPLVYDPYAREDNLILEAIAVIFCNLSPENLSCDGEISRAAVQQRYAAYQRKLRGLYAALGRTVSESESYEWSKSKDAWRKSVAS